MEKVVPFEPWHTDLMIIRDIEMTNAFALPDIKKRMESVAKATLEAATFIKDGRLVFAAGAVSLWPGVFEAWVIPSIYVPVYPIWFMKKVKNYIAAFIETFNCHRIQTVSLADEFHSRWMEKLGFFNEGTLHKYDHNKKDYAMYARII